MTLAKNSLKWLPGKHPIDDVRGDDNDSDDDNNRSDNNNNKIFMIASS